MDLHRVRVLFVCRDQDGCLEVGAQPQRVVEEERHQSWHRVERGQRYRAPEQLPPAVFCLSLGKGYDGEGTDRCVLAEYS